MVAWYICLHEWLFFYGLHVGKYTSPMDAMGISKMMFYIQSVVLHVGVSSNSGTWYPQNTPKMIISEGKPMVFGTHFRNPPVFKELFHVQSVTSLYLSCPNSWPSEPDEDAMMSGTLWLKFEEVTHMPFSARFRHRHKCQEWKNCQENSEEQAMQLMQLEAYRGKVSQIQPSNQQNYRKCFRHYVKLQP